MEPPDARHHALLGRIAELAERTAEQRRRSSEAIAAAQAVMERLTRDRADARHGKLQELVSARVAAEHAAQQKRELLGAVAHDLRQPLHVLSLAVDLLAQQAGDAGARNAEKARRAIDLIDAALNGLLDAARAEAAAVPFVRAIALQPLLKDLEEQLEPLATEKGLVFRVRPSSAIVRSEPRMLASILQNLADNALKYTVSGGVLVGARRCRDAVRLDVVDTGPGIEAGALERIFAPFVQLDAASEGVGLGLSLVRAQARELGHPVTVRSVVGKGSRFSVELPLVTAPAEKAHALVERLHQRVHDAHEAADEAHSRADALHRAVDARMPE